ncbi:MAG: class I SAM-dependent methyltransferase [Deltaproteobacteria bacterium]|nr:class I SAM-dependent methyltransferase [Deltaproteobacteria bacterium]
MDIDYDLANQTKGFMDPAEGRRLQDLAATASSLGACLEIGSYCGKSTIYLGTGCKKNKNILFSIDHHRGSEEQQPGEEYFDPELFDPDTGCVDTFRQFRKTLKYAHLEDTVVPLVCRSEIAARKWATPLGLVFIDGGHSFETAFTDYNAWSRHIVPGGYLLIHDIFPNPADGGQAPYDVYKLAMASGFFKKLPITQTLGVLQRYKCGETV